VSERSELDAPTETSAAFHELLDLIKGSDQVFLSGARAVGDDVSVVEGYQWLTELLGAALDIYVWADADRPAMVPIAIPTRKWGGDNSDARYHFAPIDPRHTYRLRGTKGDAVYVSITVYGGPDDGSWSTRIVGSRNDRDLSIAADGSFELVISPEHHDGDWLALEPDAVALVTRDYVHDPATARPTTWSITTDDPVPPPRLTDAEVARRFRAATTFLRELLAIFPLALDGLETNAVQEPYGVPSATYGWAAGDAAYAMGRYQLADGEALVLEGTAPPCAFWNLCLWNPYLQTYDYRYEQVTINDGQCQLEPDGSWRIVIAATDPGTPNWVSTAGHDHGLLWFRWFLPEETPARPAARVVPLAGLE
jgi:hypothetical protein